MEAVLPLSYAVVPDATDAASAPGGRPAERPVKRRAVRASFWVVAESGLTQCIHIGQHIVLAWLLPLQIWGLMALAGIAIRMLEMFSDIGIGPSIIQSRRGDDPVFLNTAWTLQIIRGIGLWLCACAVAYPFGVFYEKPELTALIAVVGLTSLISGFTSTNWITANRNLTLGRRTFVTLGSQTVALMVTIVWAVLSPTVWSMVAGMLAGQMVRVILSHLVLLGIRNRLCLTGGAIRELFGFSFWIFVNTLFSSLSMQMDKLILGKLVTVDVLGIYYVANRFATQPQHLLGKLTSNVVFPAISRKQDLPRHELRARLIRHRRKPLLIGALGLAVGVAFCDQVCYLIYKPEFADAAWIAPIMLLGLWPNIVISALGPALMAIGKPRYRAFASIIRFILISAAIIVGYIWLGLLGVVIASTCGSLVRYVVLSWGLWRNGLLALGQDVIATVLFVCTLAAVLVARAALGGGVPVVERLVG